MTKTLSKAQREYALGRLQEIANKAKNKVPEVQITAGQLRNLGVELLPDDKVVHTTSPSSTYYPYHKGSFCVSIPEDILESLSGEYIATIKDIDAKMQLAKDEVYLGGTDVNEILRKFTESLS